MKLEVEVGSLKEAVLVTIFDPNPNFGNRLQNYAIQEIMNRFSIDTVTLDFEKDLFSGERLIKLIFLRIIGFKGTRAPDYWRYVPKKVEKFKEFNRKYIKSKKINSIQEIPQADYYLIGSDQVWNPEWYHLNPLKKDLFLLTFADNKKRICISPSFGVSCLKEDWKEWFRDNLKRFERISVREETGADIVQELIGIRPEVLIDPTLMLNRDDWRKIASDKVSKNLINHPYLLTCFLEEPSRRTKADIDKIAKQHNLIVHNLLGYSNPDLFISGPSEFITLIDHASIVLTDSFHASVFSFIFGKPFFVYDRSGNSDNMLSRMKILFDDFGLRRKYIDKETEIDMESVLEADYCDSYKVLKKEQEKMISYLNQCM